FGWLTALYPVWARLTPELLSDAAAANLAWMALTGCTTTMDHHYVFPRDGGDLLAAEIEAARRIGLRFHATRGSMNLGQSLGWLGPDVWLAHCVHLSEAAVRRIASSGTGVAHCPTSNGRLGSGTAPVRSLLDAGAVVGLGVDGNASNESGRMVDELHQA